MDNTNILPRNMSPKILMVSLPEVFLLLEDYAAAHGGINSELGVNLRLDHMNILMDLFEDINTNPDSVEAYVRIDLLRSSLQMREVFGYISEFKLLCNRLKSVIRDTLHAMHFEDHLKREKGFFNYYVIEVNGYSVKLKYLGNSVIL